MKKIAEEKKEIVRDAKGRIVKGVAQDTNKNGTAGRPCEFCKDAERLLKISRDYFTKCKEPKLIPFIEEWALELDINDSTLVDWADKKNKKNELEHPEFYTIYIKVKNLQKLRLKQKALGRFNPHGPLTLLRFDHGAMETEKRILVGDKDNPIANKYDITITEAKNLNEE